LKIKNLEPSLAKAGFLFAHDLYIFIFKSLLMHDWYISFGIGNYV